MLTRYYYVGEFSQYMDTFKQYPHENVTFQKEEFLCSPSLALDKVFLIESGLTKLSVLHDAGENKIFGFWGEGSMFPIICTKQNFNLEYSIVMQAVTKVRVLTFSPETFKQILSEHDEITYETIDHYCRFCNMLLFNATTQSYESVRTRICSVLYLYLHYVKPKDHWVDLSQDDIASLIGTSRVTAAREFASLRNEGVLTTHRKRICVVDIEKIKANTSQYCK